ncbi:hypothetical protein BIV57_00105 [Mangrovactinospora gilvigrisea]|uniref:Aminoglycoside phosphotransferase domain-containing protein n=1 Tax=Mangrovactinospora gilvigrisea TaxID=1428644 RepID=A0A1J7BL35_9ACTN|nr:hypothetical protein BIV57_00105 [Mangrovactinospora gilvigrisea]
MKYSERLGVIEPAQLQAVAERFDLGRVTDACPLAGGLFGQNLMLETTRGRFVLRGRPHGPAQLAKERRVASLIHERSSLPAPWPYRVSEDTAVFGWSYAVMPMLPGRSGQDLWSAAGEKQRVGLAGSCGRALAMLHEAGWATPGAYDDTIDDFVPVKDPEAWWLARLEAVRGQCRAVGALTVEDERFIDGVLEQNRAALREPFRPVLVHHDFKPGNLNFTKNGDSWEPSGVFDLFEAYIADPDEDLVRMLRIVETEEERRAFLSEYVGARGGLRAGAAERLELYALADWLVIWEYGRRNRVWFEGVAFIDSVRPHLAAARRVVS